MSTEREVLQRVEALVDEHLSRFSKQFFKQDKRNPMSTDEMHALKGRAEALHSFIVNLRMELGYNPDDLK